MVVFLELYNLTIINKLHNAGVHFLKLFLNVFYWLLKFT